MGACGFVVKGVGVSPADAFNCLVQEAIDEYGNDSYNGTISTTSLIGTPARNSNPYSKEYYKEKSSWAYENCGNVSKRYCRCIDLGIKAYISRKVVVSGRRKSDATYKLKYAVVSHDCNGVEKVLCHKDKKTDAMNAAKEFIEKGKAECCTVKRQYVCLSGNPDEANVCVEIKRHDKKPRSGNYQEEHVYLFYGMAAE